MNIPLYRGVTIVTMPRFELPEFLRLLQDYRVRGAWVVPPIVLAMARHPLVDEFEVSSLEYMNSGATPLSAELEVDCGRRLGCRMQQGYGSPRPARSPISSRFVAERVAPYKKVCAVELVEEIPKSPSGKILRRILVNRERERTAALSE